MHTPQSPRCQRHEAWLYLPSHGSSADEHGHVVVRPIRSLTAPLIRQVSCVRVDVCLHCIMVAPDAQEDVGRHVQQVAKAYPPGSFAKGNTLS